MPPVTNLVVSLSPHHNVFHSGYLISASAAAGAEFEIDPTVHPGVPLVRAKGTTLAIDLHDSPSHYHEPTLAKCDVYLKRSYVSAAIPREFSAKVRPFGLNYACRTVRSTLIVLGLFCRSGFSPYDLGSYLLSPFPADFEAPPAEPPDLRILFTTRLWSSIENKYDDPEKINGFRIELVRRLRRSFGARFVGGLKPNLEAFKVFPDLRAFPDLIVNIPHRLPIYARFSRRPAIAIYSRGLHGSNGFKVAEYLASSKCIIGESLAHDLPEPLGESHRVQESIDGIIAECDRILTDVRRLNELRRISWDYYQRNLRYDRRIRILISTIRWGKEAQQA
jgi:hypothetical protein